MVLKNGVFKLANEGYISTVERPKPVGRLSFSLWQNGQRVNFTRDPMIARRWENQKIGIVKVER